MEQYFLIFETGAISKAALDGATTGGVTKPIVIKMPDGSLSGYSFITVDSIDAETGSLKKLTSAQYAEEVAVIKGGSAPNNQYTPAPILSKEDARGTQGKWRTKGFSLPVTQLVNEISLVFPYPVRVLSAKYYSRVGMEGDVVSAFIGRSLIVGVITINAEIGDSVITVPLESTGYFKVGAKVALGTEDIVAEVVSANKATGEVKIYPALTQAYEAGNLTMVSYAAMEDLELGGIDWLEEAGMSSIGSSLVPAGIPVTIIYTKSDISRPDTVFRGSIEFLH